MFKKCGEFLNILKTNKKLFYTFSLFVVLIILLIVLKIDTFKTPNISSIKTDSESDSKANNKGEYDNYTQTLESKLEDIILEIEGINTVKAMVYTKRSCMLEPIYDETINVETNTDTNSNGTKNEMNRNNTQKQVKLDSDDEALEKYYEYPEITGVLIVVNYSGDDNIYNILMNSVKVLLDVELNNIEIIVSNKKGGN
ncbi:hypothetical protein JYG23_05055 [Sedimentibacter sp. zth1]|uniref:hypothetical protein n=1 Tax=Sedimentibacter sp. zth1 TaxID=2816908 RepID=UPI001A9350C4|nr:hypothetical protein [Sedimentibacter sp. zth1]QSX06820.1 hypothetical protein JYG23_05055 [Sedimentibacter sp. zth1]